MSEADNPYAAPTSEPAAARDAPSGLIVLRTYAMATMAEFDRGLLAEHGIAAVVATGDLSAYSSAGQATLSVHPDDRDAALVVLTPAPVEAEADDEPRPRCPFCGADAVTRVRPFALAAVIPILLPLLFIRRHGCGACGQLWK